MAGQRRIVFYLDLQSPYCYLAYTFLRKSPVFALCDIAYVPMLITGLVKAGAATPPWGSPNKIAYLHRDLHRWATQCGLPWQPGFPPNYPETRTTNVQRVVTACLLECPGRLVEVLDAFFHAFWVEKKALQLAEVYEPILAAVLRDQALADRVILRGKSDEAREQVWKYTQDALADGACGLPWFCAVNPSGQRDVFWGFDHLGQMARFLDLDSTPLPHL